MIFFLKVKKSTFSRTFVLMEAKIIMNSNLMKITLHRLCYELLENYPEFQNTVLIGIQPRGGYLSSRIHKILESISGNKIQHGILDVTFHRDDFRTHKSPLSANTTEIDFLIEKKNVILVDDVLYTGRTVRAAMDALLSFGRPNQVELLTLINRRFNRELPIQPDYIGMDVDTIDHSLVKVDWKGIEDKKKDSVWLLKEEKA